MTDREKLVDFFMDELPEDHPWKGNVKRLVDKLLAAGVTFQKWIPVTERLSDWRDGKVLVFTKYGFSICERTVNGRWKGQHANRITHWMPLPEPPKEDV